MNRPSIFDLVGGRHYPRPLVGPTTKPLRRWARVLRFVPSPLWPACGPETLRHRARRIARAFLRIGDLLG